MPTEVIRYVNTASTGGDGTTNATSGATAAYASLPSALNAEERNLVTADEIAVFECSGGNDSTVWLENNLGNDGLWVCDATRYIVIRAASGQEAGTSWNTGIYRRTMFSSNNISANQAAGLRVYFEGLQIDFEGGWIDFSGEGTQEGLNYYVRFRDCYIRKTSGTSPFHYAPTNGRFGTYIFANCIFEQAYATSQYCFDGGQEGYIYYNCTTIANSTGGVWLGISSTVKNCIAQNAAAGPCFSGTFTTTATNISNDATSPQVGLRSIALDFVSATDFALAATDTEAIDAGTDLSADATYAFAVDMLGTARPQGSGWDIGAFEFVAAGASLSLPTSASITQTTATIGCTSNSDTGTLYAVVTTSATPPSAAQVEAGQDHTGTAAVFAANDATVTIGANTFAATGLTADTTYHTYFVQDIGTAEYSNVLAGTFSTLAVNVGFRISGIQGPNGAPIGNVDPVSVAVWNNAAAAHGAVADTVNAAGAIVSSVLELAHAGTIATDVLVDLQYSSGDPAVLNSVRGVTTLIDLDA